MNFFINSPSYYTKEFGVIDLVYTFCKTISYAVDVSLYTDLLDTIAVTPIIVPDNLVYRGNWSEVKKISIKYRFADISLRSDYNSYCNATDEEKKQIILENIFSSLLVIKKRLGDSFDYDKMIRDIMSSVENTGDSSLIDNPKNTGDGKTQGTVLCVN